MGPRSYTEPHYCGGLGEHTKVRLLSHPHVEGGGHRASLLWWTRRAHQSASGRSVLFGPTLLSQPTSTVVGHSRFLLPRWCRTYRCGPPVRSSTLVSCEGWVSFLHSGPRVVSRRVGCPLSSSMSGAGVGVPSVVSGFPDPVCPTGSPHSKRLPGRRRAHGGLLIQD